MGSTFADFTDARPFSLTLHDKRALEGDEKLKPILKKSTEDLGESHRCPSILKTRDDFGYFHANLLKSKPDHVRIQSPSFDCSDNIRISWTSIAAAALSRQCCCGLRCAAKEGRNSSSAALQMQRLRQSPIPTGRTSGVQPSLGSCLMGATRAKH